MSDLASSIEMCRRCTRRPVTHSELDHTTTPPSSFRLCDVCFDALMQERLDAAFGQWGRELEAAFREAGTPFPEGFSGETLIRGAVQEMHEEMQTPEFRARTEPMRQASQRIAAQVATELPGGTKHPDFMDKLAARLLEWIETHPISDDDASA